MIAGDIHWVELPIIGGREQAGRRPAIVLQEDGYAAALPTTVVVLLTSAIGALRFAGTQLIKATQASGLRADSVALVFQIRATDRSRVRAKLGSVSEEELRELRSELSKLFGIAT